jgi:hypothetical protein
MGVRGSNIRKERRRKQSRWIIDFRFIDKNGRQCRYRRDATIQSASGARAEAERLRLQLLTTGTLETRPPAPTFRAFVDGAFATIHMATRCKPETRKRYTALFRQGVLDAFGAKHLDQITAVDIRAYEALLAPRLPAARVVANSRGHTPGRQAVLRKLHGLQEDCGRETVPPPKS